MEKKLDFSEVAYSTGFDQAFRWHLITDSDAFDHGRSTATLLAGRQAVVGG
jgi:hypothetical protein